MAALKYVSLFSGGGIGDIGFRDAGLHPIVMNELEPKRAELLKNNYRNTSVVIGDIADKFEEILNTAKERLNGDRLFLLVATPPCQGMSKNGIGTIKKAIREGKRTKLDKRNYLYLHALDLVKILKPKFFVWENVDRMLNTILVNEYGEEIKFVDEFSDRLRNLGYIGNFELHNMAAYGVPQNRRRVIGVFVDENLVDNDFDVKMLFPKPVLDKNQFITVWDAIGDLPALDSRNVHLAKSSFHPLHYVPVSRKELYYWISNTKPNCSAFENDECPVCHFVSKRKAVYCEKCGTLLPKPVVKIDDNFRLIKGFVSTYKRMNANEPAPTVTTRSAYACSDKNIHPFQNRVLSLYEVALLFGIKPDAYNWFIHKGDKKVLANAMLLRDVLGEPVTPVYTKLLGENLKKINETFIE